MKAQTNTYQSALKRLDAVPEIFTGGDLTTLFGWTSAICSNYLAVWRKAKLVKSLGGRADVHMNLLRNRNANIEAALRRLYPRAIKVGVDILREAGWTTQIPRTIEVAVPHKSSIYRLHDVEVTTRTEKWYVTVAVGTERVAQSIDRLNPAWALADMLNRANDKRIRHRWLLAPDDIDLDAARQDVSMHQAIQALALNKSCLDEAEYTALYDSLLHE